MFVAKSDDELFRDAFDKVMSSIEVSNEIKGSFFLDYKPAFEAGDPRAECKVALTYFYGSGWKWHEYERWKEVFDQRGEWPYSWVSNDLVVATDPQIRDKALCKLLVNTISRTFWGLRHFQQIQDILNDPGTPKVTEYIVFAKCDDTDTIGVEFADRFNNGQLQGIPPFFPGDNNKLFCRRERKR